MAKVFASFGAVALVGFLTACGGSGSPSQGDSSAPITSKCTNEKRATAFTAGMAEKTTSGIQVFLDDSDPSPPALGKNTWTLRVEDATGAPVTDATLDLSPWMPDHKHGSPLAPKFTNNGDGTYKVTPVDFNMDGYWEITVAVNSKTDNAMFPLCVE